MNSTEYDTKYLFFIFQRAISLGVKVILSPTEKVLYENILCSGYFTDKTDPPTLAVATKRPDWILIFLHESQHMEQWSEKLSPKGIELWNRSKIAWDFITEWLDGKEIDDISDHIDIAQHLEIDCEKRTVKILNQMKIPILRYIQNCNSYLLYYPYMKAYRKWYSKPPYDFKELVDMMPEHFLSLRQYKQLPRYYEKFILSIEKEK